MVASKGEPIFAHVNMHGFRWKFMAPSSSRARNSVMKIAERSSLKILPSPNTNWYKKKMIELAKFFQSPFESRLKMIRGLSYIVSHSLGYCHSYWDVMVKFIPMVLIWFHDDSCYKLNSTLIFVCFADNVLKYFLYENCCILVKLSEICCKRSC